ncbi:MAG TPA: hypothetical protein IAC56_00415 [Candidatus Aphodousia faecigallinarum]|uniref:Uncharacterized protein n=1 Tax=Candidatus Aphodousia faecigallinarum TaxID=2840677 RepID=A0A9D1IJ41_9BURK|nr:hypothetical protein [Candidatus Aphodousia faecigallinarum]
MRKRFDPSLLEPKNGDFADFVEKLNQKSVAELKALQVNDEQMREQINDDLNGAATGVWTSPNVDPPKAIHKDTVINQPEDAFKVDFPQGDRVNKNRSDKVGNASTVILIFLGFALFFYGGMNNDEELIGGAFLLVLITIFSNIIRQKRQRRR